MLCVMSCILLIISSFVIHQKTSEIKRTEFQRWNSILLSQKEELEDKYTKEVVSHLTHCQKAQHELTVRNKQLAILKTMQLCQLESTKSHALSIAFASAAIAVNSTVGELCKQKDIKLSSTIEGLLRDQDEERAVALNNLSRDKDDERKLALEQMCVEKDVVTNQDNIILKDRISLLARKNNELDAFVQDLMREK